MEVDSITSESLEPETASQWGRFAAAVKRGWSKFAIVVSPIGMLLIGLGNYSDAMMLVRTFGTDVFGVFTNQFEYETIGRIHVGNTVGYIEGVVGKPQVSRAIDETTTANYFYSTDYLLTLFYRSDRVAGYTIVSLTEGFTPDVDIQDQEDRPLGEFLFSDVPVPPQGFSVEDSRTIRFYVESLDPGRPGRFVDTYLGNIYYGGAEPPSIVNALYQAEIDGDTESTPRLRTELRSNLRPNLYGRGELGVEQIEASLLTISEMKGYFGYD